MAAQLAEKRARDEAEAAEKAGKVEFREQLRPRIDAWCAGKKDNIRALLSSMHTVMWEGSGWVQPSMADMVDGNKVRVRVFVCACVRGACVRACVCGAAAVLGGGVADECDASAHPLHHYTTPAGQALLHEGQPGCSPRQGEPGRQAGRQRGACVGWAGHRARARLPPARRVHPRHPRTHPPTPSHPRRSSRRGAPWSRWPPLTWCLMCSRLHGTSLRPPAAEHPHPTRSWALEVARAPPCCCCPARARSHAPRLPSAHARSLVTPPSSLRALGALFHPSTAPHLIPPACPPQFGGARSALLCARAGACKRPWLSRGLFTDGTRAGRAGGGRSGGASSRKGGAQKLQLRAGSAGGRERGGGGGGGTAHAAATATPHTSKSAGGRAVVRVPATARARVPACAPTAHGCACPSARAHPPTHPAGRHWRHTHAALEAGRSSGHQPPHISGHREQAGLASPTHTPWVGRCRQGGAGGPQSRVRSASFSSRSTVSLSRSSK